MDAFGYPRAQTTYSPVSPAHDRPPPEELWDIICNDTVLPINMTLAAVRQYVWRQSSEVVLYYRRKRSGTQKEVQRTVGTTPSIATVSA
jgi:hypothetical protein